MIWPAGGFVPQVDQAACRLMNTAVRHFSQRVVRDYGGRLVRINPREAGVGSALDVGLACEALAGLVAIDRVLRA